MTYADLKAQIQRWTHNNALDPAIPDFVRLFEAFANRTLRLQPMRTTDYLIVEDGRAALPTGFLEMASTRSDQIPLIFGSDRIPVGPGGFSYDNDGLVFNKDTGGAVWISFYKKFDALAEPDDTNWLLQNAPDAYLFGALTEAEPYMVNDARVALWKSKRDEALVSLQLADDRMRFSGGTLVIRNPIAGWSWLTRGVDDGGLGASFAAVDELWRFVNYELPTRV